MLFYLSILKTTINRYIPLLYSGKEWRRVYRNLVHFWLYQTQGIPSVEDPALYVQEVLESTTKYN